MISGRMSAQYYLLDLIEQARTMSQGENHLSQQHFLEFIADPKSLLIAFEQAQHWQEKYRQIMLLGKSLAKMDDSLKVEQAQVQGCESDAWLYHMHIDGKHYFIADSDARVVKGLIALLLGACQGQDSATIAAFDPAAYFTELGIAGQLSPSRTNGLYALANAIKAVV